MLWFSQNLVETKVIECCFWRLKLALPHHGSPYPHKTTWFLVNPKHSFVSIASVFPFTCCDVCCLKLSELWTLLSSWWHYLRWKIVFVKGCRILDQAYLNIQSAPHDILLRKCWFQAWSFLIWHKRWLGLEMNWFDYLNVWRSFHYIMSTWLQLITIWEWRVVYCMITNVECVVTW